MKPAPTPPFDFYHTHMINVPVTVVMVAPGAGNAGPDKEYQVQCDDITVSYNNTVINFRLVPPTDPSIVFHGFTPRHASEFSPPSLSVDQKMITFSDLNSKKAMLDISLQFEQLLKDGQNGHRQIFGYDPQVGNDPVVLDPPPAANLR